MRNKKKKENIFSFDKYTDPSLIKISIKKNRNKIIILILNFLFHRDSFAQSEHCQDSRWRMNIEILIIPTCLQFGYGRARVSPDII